MSTILFVDRTAGYDPKLIFERPTGGCLTSLTRVSEELVKHGHRVFVSSTHEQAELVNGVQYLGPNEKAPKWDVAVLNRNVLPADFVAYCKEQGSKIIWWLHDIVDPRYLVDDTFKQVDKIVAQSQYCASTFSDFYDIDRAKISCISNGIEPSIFYTGPYEKRSPNIYITASALIKGFFPLDLCFLNLKEHNPNLDFRIYSSQKLHGFKNSPAQEQWLDRMSVAGAHVYSPMSPRSLATVMRQAWALLMPNSYPEMCSNLLLQARACGLPVITSGIGANPEFLTHKQNGLITKYAPHDIHMWSKEFTELACKLYFDRELHRDLSVAAPNNVPTWESVGNEWNSVISEVLSQKLQNV